MSLRVTLRVRPSASVTKVGGAYGEALVVKVREHAAEGAATDAALVAVADAFGVRTSAVTLVSGVTGRRKIVDIDGGTKEALDLLLTSQG